MLDVLVYLFHTYYTPEACPDQRTLARKLSTLGFESEEISDALGWLAGLATTTQNWTPLDTAPSNSLRIYVKEELEALGVEGMGFIAFLEGAGVLNSLLRELVIERILAIQERPVPLEAIKIVTLMVLWSQESEVDSLILEELLEDGNPRELH